MSKVRSVFLFALIMTVAFATQAMAEEPAFAAKLDTGTGSLHGVSVTTSQTAVFAAFLSDIPGDPTVSTAISVSNPLTPAFIDVVTSSITGQGDTQGTLQFFLYGQDGSLINWDTGTDPTVGIGLNEDGTLGPGQTYTVLLRDILTAAGVDGPFVGHGVLVANLDAVVGTYNVTIFGLGFTQNFEFLPGPYQGVFQAGVPVSGSSSP